jgi:hypothetical protein
MTTRQADEPLRLSPIPGELWDMDRRVDELRADDHTIRRWVWEGRLPGPCLRRNGRAF